jgi:hypothetical protein
LTPTGLLMEGDYTHRPWMAILLAGSVLRLAIPHS